MTPQTGPTEPLRATLGDETADVVARAREALAGVTREPWKFGNRSYPDVVHTPNGCLWNPTCGDINNQRDGEFVAAARSLIPELIAEVERLSEFVSRIGQIAEHEAGIGWRDLLSHSMDEAAGRQQVGEHLRAELARLRAGVS